MLSASFDTALFSNYHSYSIMVKAFHKACSNGLTDIAEVLLECAEEYELINSRDEYLQTVLHSTTRNDKCEMISMLLER